MRNRLGIPLVIALGVGGVDCATAQTTATPAAVTVPVPPATSQENFEIELPASEGENIQRVRIKNLANGREVSLPVGTTKVLAVPVVELRGNAPAAQTIVPQISILIYRRGQLAADAATRADGMGGYSFSRSLVFDQPTWRRVGVRQIKLPGGGTRLQIDMNPRAGARAAKLAPGLAPAPVIKPEQKTANLDEGFLALTQREYTRAIQIFSQHLSSPDLAADARGRALLGRAIGLFHKRGCAVAEKEFLKAERARAPSDDIAYYRALCLIEAEQFAAAETLLRELVKKESPSYSEHGRFFLGVTAENLGRLDDAETVYLDTIDFAKDAELVKLARERLETVRRSRRSGVDWFSGLVSVGVGYDSNVFSLPRALDPTVAVSGTSDWSLLGLASAEFRLPYTKFIDHRLRYTLLLLHYSQIAVAREYDIQSHDLGTTAAVALGERDALTVGVSYNSIFKGLVGEFSEYLANTGGSVDWTHALGNAQSPSSRLNISYVFTAINPRTVQIAAYDLTAYSHQLRTRWTKLKDGGHQFGPVLELEWRRAVGNQNTFLGTRLGGFWQMPVGPSAWGLHLVQEGGVDAQFYYVSANDGSDGSDVLAQRRDATARYSAGLSKLWMERFETRFQLLGNLTDSTRASARFQRYQLNLLVSAFF